MEIREQPKRLNVEVTKERTMVIPQNDPQTYVTEWKYDTWNRLTSMTYADGEVVDYTYNVGRLSLSMSGKKKGSTFGFRPHITEDRISAVLNKQMSSNGF